MLWSPKFWKGQSWTFYLQLCNPDPKALTLCMKSNNTHNSTSQLSIIKLSSLVLNQLCPNRSPLEGFNNNDNNNDNLSLI